MPEIILQYQAEIWQSIGETFVMVGVSIAAAFLIGLPVGTLLYFAEKDNCLKIVAIYSSLNIFVNIVRSFPFSIACCIFNSIYKVYCWDRDWYNSRDRPALNYGDRLLLKVG